MLRLHNIANTTTRSAPQLSGAESEDDELIAEIENDHKGPDDMWELNNEPDVQGIDSFWSGVQTDLKSDPNWYSFTSD